VPTDLQRTLDAGGQVAVRDVTGLGCSGGRDAEDLASVLLGPLLAVVPLQPWSRALPVARAADSAPAGPDVAGHVVVSDGDAVAGTALARATQQSRDDAQGPSASLETLAAAVASVGERQWRRRRRRRVPRPTARAAPRPATVPCAT